MEYNKRKSQIKIAIYEEAEIVEFNECEWINKQKEGNYFKLSVCWCIPFEKCGKKTRAVECSKETNAHFEHCTMWKSLLMTKELKMSFWYV